MVVHRKDFLLRLGSLRKILGIECSAFGSLFQYESLQMSICFAYDSVEIDSELASDGSQITSTKMRIVAP